MLLSRQFTQLLFALLLLRQLEADGLDGSCQRHAEDTLQASVLLQTSEARRSETAAGSSRGHYNDWADNPEDDYMEKAAHLHEHVQPKQRSNLLATGHDPETYEDEEPDADFASSPASCITEASFGATASEGSSCVFGVDDRDEGTHCIQDIKYGEFGWCYTQADASLWGICSVKCPIYGPNLVLDKKLEVVETKLTALMEEVDAMPVKCKGKCSKAKPKEVSKSAAKHGGKSGPSGKKADAEPKEAKHGGKASASAPPKQAKHGGKESPSSKAPPKESKEAKHGGKEEPGAALLRQYRRI